MTNTATPTPNAPVSSGEYSNPLGRFSDEFMPHASRRMQQRGITQEMITLTLQYGRVKYAKGAQHYIVGRKEVDYAAREGQDLRSCNGIHLLLSSEGEVITVYRNRSSVSVRPRKRMSRRLFKTDMRRSWSRVRCEMQELVRTFEKEIYEKSRKTL